MVGWARSLLQDNSATFKILVVIVIFVKTCLAAATPLGYDFVSYMIAAVGKDQSVSWSPWILVVANIYAFWLDLPIVHGNVIRAIALAPNELLPADYLIAWLVKLPLLVSDVVAFYLVYKLGTLIGGSKSVGRLAALLWLVNPFSTLFVEMWGSVDVVAIALGLAGVYLIVCGRGFWGALALAFGVIWKPITIVLWLALLAWTLRRRPDLKTKISVALAGPFGMAGYFLWVTHGMLDLSGVTAFFASSVYSEDTYVPVIQTFSEYLIGEPYTLGLAVFAVASFYLICAEVWPEQKSEVVNLILPGFMIVFGLAFWFPTAFLWALPFIAIWSSKNLKSGFSWTFCFLLAVFIGTFYGQILVVPGRSFLFLPNSLIPFPSDMGTSIGAAVRVHLGLLVNSVFSGFCLVFGGTVAWRSLRKREL